MNKVILSGRLTKDPEVKQTPSNLAVCSFTIACDRRFKNQNGERQSDFINCVAWRQQATILGNYFHKGSRISIVGSIQSRSYEDNGRRVYIQEVVVDEIEFVDTRKDTEAPAKASEPEFVPVPVPPLPKMTGEVEAAIMQSEADAAEAEVELPFDISGY